MAQLISPSQWAVNGTLTSQSSRIVEIWNPYLTQQNHQTWTSSRCSFDGKEEHHHDAQTLPLVTCSSNALWVTIKKCISQSCAKSDTRPEENQNNSNTIALSHHRVEKVTFFCASFGCPMVPIQKAPGSIFSIQASLEVQDIESKNDLETMDPME